MFKLYYILQHPKYKIPSLQMQIFLWLKTPPFGLEPLATLYSTYYGWK